MSINLSDDFNEAYYLAANPDVAMAVRAGFYLSGRDHWLRCGRKEGRVATAEQAQRSEVPTKGHRAYTAQLLHGRGLEIGALESPWPTTDNCEVTYVDRFGIEQAREMFPELKEARLQAPDRIVDINKNGLDIFDSESQDFVICSHVLEHVANPIYCLREILRVTRPGGHVVLAVPDKRYNPDAPRALTSFDHLLEEYRQGVTSVSPAHYVDLVALSYPEDIAKGVDAIQKRLTWLERRSEHAHVWDTQSFKRFLLSSAMELQARGKLLFEAVGDETRFEYVCAFEKHSGPGIRPNR